MRSTLFTLFLLSLEASPAASLRIPLPLQSPSRILVSSKNENGKRSLGKWDMGTELRTQGMNWDKRHLDKPGPAANDGARPHKNQSRGAKADGEEVARVMNANDNHQDDNGGDEDDEGGRKLPTKGKKSKHIPGSHHRDDRHPPSSHPDSDLVSKKHHGKQKRPGRKGKHQQKRYLSSNPRTHEKKELSFWDYDRHTKRMGEFDPLHGTGLREERAAAVEMEKRGHGADERKGTEDGGRAKHSSGRHAKHGGKGRHAHAAGEVQAQSGSAVRHDDFHASNASNANTIDRPHNNAASMEQSGQVRGDSLPDLHKQDTLPAHRQGVTLGDGSILAQSLASPAANRHGASPGGTVPVPSSHANHVRGLLDNLRVDDMLDFDSEAYDCEEEFGHGHGTLIGRDESGNGNGDGQDWQPDAAPPAEPAPAPGPPQQVSVVDGGPRLYADRIIWQPKSDHPEKHGELQRRRKNKHKDEDEDDSGGKHGRNRHGDDYEDEDDDQGSQKKKHRGDEEEDEYGSSSSKNGKGRYDDEEEGYEDEYSAKGTGNRTKGKGSFDGDVPYSKSNPLSGFDDEDGYPTKPIPKSKFDDGQYRPSTYANSGIDDCATLSSFYVSMRGETWSPPVDWSASAVSSSAKGGCCTWTGVTCDEYERVIGMDVSSLGLSGPLGSELFSLDALLRLDISGNALTSLPDRFDTLPTLANMNAASNNLTGPIPTTLLTHPTLKTLNLASNSFNGDIMINSVNLTSVSLGKNQLSGIRVVEGSGLVKVDISENKFQGLLPDLTASSGLQIFDASNNNTGTLFDISRMTSLTRLDVRTNALSGPFPSSLTQLKRLTSLYLSYNAFTGPFPSEPAPPMLASCYVTPNPIVPCPTAAELADPDSLASKCHASCPKAPGAGGRAGAAGIPVSPLPGEAGTIPLYIDPTSKSYVLAPDTSSQPASVNVNANGVASQPGAYNQPSQPMVNGISGPPMGNVPPPYNNNGMDASGNGIGGTRQQQMIGATTPMRVANESGRDSLKTTWVMVGLACAVASSLF